MLPKEQCQQLNSAPGSAIHVLEKGMIAHITIRIGRTYVGFCLGIRHVPGAGVPRGIWELR